MAQPHSNPESTMRGLRKPKTVNDTSSLNLLMSNNPYRAITIRNEQIVPRGGRLSAVFDGSPENTTTLPLTLGDGDEPHSVAQFQNVNVDSFQEQVSFSDPDAEYEGNHKKDSFGPVASLSKVPRTPARQFRPGEQQLNSPITLPEEQVQNRPVASYDVATQAKLANTSTNQSGFTSKGKTRMTITSKKPDDHRDIAHSLRTNKVRTSDKQIAYTTERHNSARQGPVLGRSGNLHHKASKENEGILRSEHQGEDAYSRGRNIPQYQAQNLQEMRLAASLQDPPEQRRAPSEGAPTFRIGGSMRFEDFPDSAQTLRQHGLENFSILENEDEFEAILLAEEMHGVNVQNFQTPRDSGCAPVMERYLHKAAEQLLSDQPEMESTQFVHSSQAANQTTFSRSSASVHDDEDYGFCCDQAQQLFLGSCSEVSYCYTCKTTFCSECWDAERAHKRNVIGHEKVDAGVARLIAETLEVNCDEHRQAMLHVLDESASWFGAIRDQNGVVFRDFGRYASLLSELDLEHRKRAYPALVSFVGDTGAGKSSLVKLLVKTQQPKTPQDNLPLPQDPQTPVVGRSGATTPTSGDVHLYADPESFLSNRPILYADCEGLRGGTLEPLGAKLRRKVHTTAKNQARTASFDRHVRRRHETAEREVLWANSPEKSTHVIVFVVKNARMIEEVTEQLIIWADAVIESANNQPVLPHAIIVLNASDNQDSRLWNIDNSTNALLDALDGAVGQNPRLQSFAYKWISRGFEIVSVQQLLLAYYSSVRVVRIPERRQPSLIHDQIKQLYQEIEYAVTQSHNEKLEKRLRLNAESLQPYLQRAFDHFCLDLHDPFDFIKASFADAGIPSDFCGNTLKLTVQIMQQRRWASSIDGDIIFKELSFLVASCIMLDAVRNQKLGEATGLFREYVDHIDETVDDFNEKVWPCEFVDSAGNRCINVRVGHIKGHQLNKGRVVAGEYVSSSSVDILRKSYRDYVFHNLDELLSRLKTATNEQEEAARLHQEEILGPFYEHLGGAELYVSNSTCLSCLLAPAEHCLPCKHVLCTPCVKAFGSRRSPYILDMKFCPLHKSSENGWYRTIVLKPEKAGTRILSLDGGGVRGILMLMTLQEIQRDLGDIAVQNFFDLVIGTSTGGIIALGLVEMGWEVGQCLDKFRELVHHAFQRNRNKVFHYFPQWLVNGWQGGLYSMEPLEDILTAQFKDHKLFGGPGPSLLGDIIPARVAVTTTSTNGTPFLLANYNRLEADENARYTFLRADKPEGEIQIWEAARCTSAAPKLFKPYSHKLSGHTFVDGGIYYNNPIEVALRENGLIWPLEGLRLPDIALSLGTGVSDKKAVTQRQAVSSSRTGLGQITQHYKQLLKIATDHVKSSLRSEDEYRRVREHYGDSQLAYNCFKRFNYHFPSNFGKLDTDCVDKLPDLKEFANTDLKARKQEIRDISDRLIASSFFFDVEVKGGEKKVGGVVALRGHIRCRFSQGSPEMRKFGDLLRSRIREVENTPGNARHSACFVVEDKLKPLKAVQVPLDEDTIEMMRSAGNFNMGRVTVEVCDYHAESDIYLRFGGESDEAIQNSISGFPRSWDARQLTHVASRLNMSEMRTRQASRRNRPEWKEPETRPRRLLTKFSQARNPGMAADEELVAVASRLSSSTPRGYGTFKGHIAQSEKVWEEDMHKGFAHPWRNKGNASELSGSPTTPAPNPDLRAMNTVHDELNGTTGSLWHAVPPRSAESDSTWAEDVTNGRRSTRIFELADTSN